MNYFVESNCDDMYKKAISRILVSARKNRGMSQRELARQTGISPSILSRSESGHFMLSAANWITVCNSLKISPDSLKYGFIDSGIYTHESRFEGQLKLEGQYAENDFIQVRQLFPIFKYLDTVGSGDFLSLVQDKLDVDVAYLMFADNWVNLKFVSDLLDMIQGLDVNRDVYGDVAMERLAEFCGQQLQFPMVHGKVSDNYNLCKNKEELLEAYVSVTNCSQSLYRYRILEKSNKGNLLLEVVPTEYMNVEFWKLAVPQQIFFYAGIENGIRGMSKYPIVDPRAYHLSSISDLIKNDSDSSFVFDLRIA